mgnify:FL=1
MPHAIQFNGGLTLSLAVSDLDRALAWYQSVLGFELIYRRDDIGWCELTTGVERVNLGLSVMETVTPGGATPTFGVEDIEAARASLVDHGVSLDGEILVIDELVKLQTFYDPDGNSFMFYEELAGAPYE